MASKTIVLLEDDLDGGEASQTVTFGLDGTAYEIDLNDKNASKLRESLNKYVGAARRQPRTAHRVSPAAPRAHGANGTRVSRHSAREMRDWARTQGLDVPEKGRVPGSIAQAFEAAHPGG